jgi:hypothetical protein
LNIVSTSNITKVVKSIMHFKALLSTALLSLRCLATLNGGGPSSVLTPSSIGDMLLPAAAITTLLHEASTPSPYPSSTPSSLAQPLEIGHHFRHIHTWIAASKDNGCMSIESDNPTNFALNRLAHRATGMPGRGKTLVCSLRLGICQWKSDFWTGVE